MTHQLVPLKEMPVHIREPANLHLCSGAVWGCCHPSKPLVCSLISFPSPAHPGDCLPLTDRYWDFHILHYKIWNERAMQNQNGFTERRIQTERAVKAGGKLNESQVGDLRLLLLSDKMDRLKNGWRCYLVAKLDSLMHGHLSGNLIWQLG